MASGAPARIFLLAVILVILHANQCCGSKSVGSMSFSFWASRIRILPSSSKNRKKNVDSTVLWLLYDFLSSKTDVNVPSNSKKQENFRIRFSVVRIRGSGSVSKCHGWRIHNTDGNVFHLQIIICSFFEKLTKRGSRCESGSAKVTDPSPPPPLQK